MITFFQGVISINIKRSFSRLTLICEILMLENLKDMEEFYGLGLGGIFLKIKIFKILLILEFSLEDIKKIVKLRVDL